MFEIKVPEFGESIQEVQVASWLKQPGDWVDKDEDIVELESEKASQALASPEAGTLASVHVAEGEFAQIGDVLCELKPGEKPISSPTTTSKSQQAAGASGTAVVDTPPQSDSNWIMPAAKRVLSEYKISADAITPTGSGGRLLKEDVLNYIEANGLKPPGTDQLSDDTQTPESREPSFATEATPSQATPSQAETVSIQASQAWEPEIGDLGFSREESVRPMSMIRRTIASRLVEAQQTAALLTTFNEIDMKPVMELRKKYQEAFSAKHGVNLGFMSFFAKASVEALKRFPAINCQIRGTDIVSRNYYDIGIAIGGGKGLVVPVLRSVERISFADIERKIVEFAQRVQGNKINPSDLEGGTFTITNGGIYGSLLSTPIINPPQSGILGLHAIQDRPVALNGEVVIRPMMYVALTYDHRVVDGREAVGFLKTIKEVLEEPARLFLEV